MEILLALGIAFGAVWLGRRHATVPGVPGGQTSGAGPVGQDPGASGPGPGPAPAPAPPAPVVPAAPQTPGPGVYPPGTVGALPVSVSAIGGDGDNTVTATPGGTAHNNGITPTFWYGPGTWVVFQAKLDTSVLGGLLSAFDHFEGPGVSTRQNPIRVQITEAGYVRGVFAFLGQLGA